MFSGTGNTERRKVRVGVGTAEQGRGAGALMSLRWKRVLRTPGSCFLGCLGARASEICSGSDGTPWFKQLRKRGMEVGTL
jgi:hypothetical protein